MSSLVIPSDEHSLETHGGQIDGHWRDTTRESDRESRVLLQKSRKKDSTIPRDVLLVFQSPDIYEPGNPIPHLISFPSHTPKSHKFCVYQLSPTIEYRPTTSYQRRGRRSVDIIIIWRDGNGPSSDCMRRMVCVHP